MGIDISWKMIQGATEKEWEEALSDNGEFKEWDDSTGSFLQEQLGMDCLSPYFDAASEHCIYGYEISFGDGATEVHLPALVDKAISADQSLRNEFGLISRTIVSQHLY